MNDICHKSNENTDKYKNQRAAAVVLIKIYFCDYIMWFSEPCTVCNNCNCDCSVVYVRQHKDSSIKFAETALY